VVNEEQGAERELPEAELPEIDPSTIQEGQVAQGGDGGQAPPLTQIKPDEEAAAPAEDPSVTLVVDVPPPAVGLSMIRLVGAGLGVHEKAEYRRALNVTGTGARRCKIFYSKIATGPMEYMQKAVNDWLDAEDLEVKFVTQVVGVLEGKRSEPNLIITIWY
jgi:hypothetical protein